MGLMKHGFEYILILMSITARVYNERSTIKTVRYLIVGNN